MKSTFNLTINSDLCKFSVDPEKPNVITGYAAVFYDPAKPETQFNDGYRVYRVAKSAFNRSIQNDDVKCLFNHNDSQLLGRNKSGTLTLSVDDYGLKYSCNLPDTQAGNDVKINIARNDIYGSSFQMKHSHSVVKRFSERDNSGNVINIIEMQDISLIDVGPVTNPAFKTTTVSMFSASPELKEHFDQLDREEQQRLIQSQHNSRQRRLDLLSIG